MKTNKQALIQPGILLQAANPGVSATSAGNSQVSGATVSQSETVYEFARASSLDGWWAWALLIASLALVLFTCIRYYRRDAGELPRPIGLTLMFLRVTIILALVFFFFDLSRRVQRRITRPSEVVVLVDTSQSMSLPATGGLESDSRSERAAALIGESELITGWAQQNRVSIYTFGDQQEPESVQTIGGVDDEQQDAGSELGSDTDSGVDGEAIDKRSRFALVGGLLVLGGIIMSIISLLIAAFRTSSSKSGPSTIYAYWVAGAAITLVLGIVLVGGVASVSTESGLTQLLGLPESYSSSNPDDSVTDGSADRSDDDSGTGDGLNPSSDVPDWGSAVSAVATQSRIGDALRSVLSDHDPTTLAGVVVLTDGQSNGGSDPNAAIATAKRSEIAVYPVGLGSSDAPVNVRLVDLDAPRRVYPGDKFAVSGVLQASGPNPVEVEVQLIDGLDNEESSDQDDGGDSETGTVVDSQKVAINNDGTLSGIRFEIEPESVGKRRLSVRIVSPAEDRNKKDDRRSTRYEVVSRKLRVLAVAGGPTREYRFVRNLLYRDKSTELDAWLQTGQPGISQDADRLLTAFPSTAEDLFQYDAIAMFDPDWNAISAEQLDLLDRWLAQQAGGLILVAGPVYHSQWLRKRTDPRTARIAGFFPVNLSSQSVLFAGGRQGGENAWPPDFTPEARRAEFLWIADNPEDSFQVWDDFAGVYDFVDAKSAKPGAKVYTYFSDPTTQISGSLPVYMASQFYGAGRIYFQGSGEMWRLRGESDAYFDSFYTKLIRWVSEGRLLRDSNRGILLVDTSRAMVGDTVTVRAVLTDDQFEPLDVPEVPAKLLAPGGRIDDLMLTPLQGEPKAGTYGGRFIVREAGDYQIRLTLGDALDEQVLRQNVQVRLPTVELERPRRNDDELGKFASLTGGKYLPVDFEVTNDEVAEQLLAWIQPQPQTTILPGTPDIDFTRRRNLTLMWLIATMLTMEWVTRRLHRLA